MKSVVSEYYCPVCGKTYESKEGQTVPLLTMKCTCGSLLGTTEGPFFERVSPLTVRGDLKSWGLK